MLTPSKHQQLHLLRGSRICLLSPHSWAPILDLPITISCLDYCSRLLLGLPDPLPLQLPSPEGSCEHLSHIEALSCSESSCGSISLKVKMGVLTMAHKIPCDLVSFQPPSRTMSRQHWPLSYSPNIPGLLYLFSMPGTPSPIPARFPPSPSSAQYSKGTHLESPP